MKNYFKKWKKKDIKHYKNIKKINVYIHIIKIIHKIRNNHKIHPKNHNLKAITRKIDNQLS